MLPAVHRNPVPSRSGPAGSRNPSDRLGRRPLGLRAPFLAGKNGKELFDLTEDLGESRNIANDNPAIVERMSKDLDAWIASVNRSKAGADYRK